MHVRRPVRDLKRRLRAGAVFGRDLSQQLQCNVLGYDYTGYGASTGACQLPSALVLRDRVMTANDSL